MFVVLFVNHVRLWLQWGAPITTGGNHSEIRIRSHRIPDVLEVLDLFLDEY